MAAEHDANRGAATRNAGPGARMRTPGPRPGDRTGDRLGDRLEHADFSVVVKNRAPPPKPWRWEIYRAGRKSAVDYSSVFYETVTEANRAGKKALELLLTEFPA